MVCFIPRFLKNWYNDLCFIWLHIYMHVYIFYSLYEKQNSVIKIMYLFHCFLDPLKYCRCFSELEKTMYLIYRNTSNSSFCFVIGSHKTQHYEITNMFSFIFSLQFSWSFNLSKLQISRVLELGLEENASLPTHLSRYK